MALGMCLDNGAQTGFFVQDFSPPAFLFEACVCVYILVNEINSEACLGASSDKS